MKRHPQAALPVHRPSRLHRTRVEGLRRVEPAHRHPIHRRSAAAVADPQATPEAPANDGEMSPFVITESHPPTVQLRLQHAVFFVEERDHVALLALKPAT
jgi:hypothetical protein